MKGSAENTDRVLDCGALSINPDTLTVVISGQHVYLTKKEFAFLELLIRRKGTIVSKQMILDHVYANENGPTSKTIDVFFLNLRKKLSALSGDRPFIETIWGRGYIIREDHDAPAAVD